MYANKLCLCSNISLEDAKESNNEQLIVGSYLKDTGEYMFIADNDVEYKYAIPLDLEVDTV